MTLYVLPEAFESYLDKFKDLFEMSCKAKRGGLHLAGMTEVEGTGSEGKPPPEIQLNLS